MTARILPLALLFLAIQPGSTWADPLARQSSSLVVKTNVGSFQGVSVANGTERWLGVPFAQPPLGKLRFKAPQAIKSPKAGITDASNFGNACPQPITSSLGAPVGEDCLVLNARILHVYGKQKLTRGICIYSDLETEWYAVQCKASRISLVLCE